jgi:glycosyltransferase involved in cell wall biosynthesis
MTALATDPLPYTHPSPRRVGDLSVLQIGAEWFAELGGGLNRYYCDLLRYLPQTGVRYRGLVAGSPSAVSDPAVRPFAPIKLPLRRRWVAEWKLLREELASQRFDLIASHFSAYAVPVIARPIHRPPLVVHFHGPWADESRRNGGGMLGPAVKATLERLVYRSADRLIVLSEAFAGVLRDSYGVRGDRIRVVPGGIDCDRFDIPTPRRDARAQLGWPTDRPIVLTVRRLVRRMGLEHLIDATVALRKRVPDVLVLIAGTGVVREDLAARIAAAGLSHHVRLLGFLPDVDLPLAYRAADVTVVPSVALEGFGLVAVESLAAGTPVVVTRVGGLPEVVTGLSDRLVVPPASPPDLAATLGDVLLDGAGHWPTAGECRAYARAAFDWPAVVHRVADVYADVLH